MQATILIVDDEKHTREGLQQALEDQYDVYLAANADQAFNLMATEPFNVILTDLKMAGKNGLSVIDQAIQLPSRPVIIMMTAYGNVETAVEAMKHGATDFLTKPLNLEKLEILIKRALKTRKIEEENTNLHERLDKAYRFEGIIGHSAALQSVLERIKLVAPSKATVLLEGATGTGKELAAQAIHQNSARARKPFIPVHCAALPATLLESELFGHEKGAFTGAAERHIGRFEAANGGSLFLDEIGEIDASTQVKLLRFLETKTLERLGSVKPIIVDVRLIVATNRNLEAMLAEGEFREDLYYRLNVVKITLPALKERTDDIPVLLNHFVQGFSAENKRKPLHFSPQAMEILQCYDWPGNIRELRNFAENIVVTRREDHITPQSLDTKFLKETDTAPTQQRLKQPLSVEENEKQLLRNALVEAKGNRTRAAQLLGVSRRTLHRKLFLWPELDTRK